MEAYGIAQGDAGLALMCASMNAWLPGQGWDELAHGFLTAGVRAAERQPRLSPSLFGGLSGLAFAASALSGGTRYRRLLANLDGALAPEAVSLGEGLRLGNGPGPMSDFDVISGASGIGAYLLRRDPYEVLPQVLTGLVSLAEQRDGPPRWMTPPDLLGDPSMTRQFPSGNLNCGLAHGIPGPLALLALSLRGGVEVPGQADAVRRLAYWLLGHRADDEWGVNWPAAIPVTPPGAQDDPGQLPPARSAWCYGSPGVARALWFAGEALDDQGLRDFAVEAMHAISGAPSQSGGSSRRPTATASPACSRSCCASPSTQASPPSPTRQPTWSTSYWPPTSPTVRWPSPRSSPDPTRWTGPGCSTARQVSP